MSDQAYFRQLNQMLKNHSRALPSLLLDLDRLDENIAVLNKDWNPHAQFRIVVKSLPCMGLLDYLMEKTKTKKLMVFHQPFLSELAGRLDAQADMLLGKPMPIKTAQYFYDHLPNLENDFDPFRQIQWLVDSPKRLEQYLALAQRLGHPLRINLEIDVGLHRGGFATLAELRASLEWLLAHQEDLIFSGLMGYDPHVVKLPKMIRSPQRALQLANDFYQQCKTLIRAEFPALWSENLTFNGAGSPTLKLHLSNSSPLNDISAGSCLVKPTTFDLSTLTDYKAACFIATPILKAFKNTQLPALEGMKKALNFLDRSHAQSFFIYGGFWKADYHYPKGLKQNALFGASTNQTMLNAPTSVQLNVDDFVFLRPHQSEFVFLQFGKILVIRKGTIIAEWSPLKNE